MRERRLEEAIKVEAPDAGADDYVTKPFSINELLDSEEVDFWSIW